VNDYCENGAVPRCCPRRTVSPNAARAQREIFRVPSPTCKKDPSSTALRDSRPHTARRSKRLINNYDNQISAATHYTRYEILTLSSTRLGPAGTCQSELWHGQATGCLRTNERRQRESERPRSATS